MKRILCYFFAMFFIAQSIKADDKTVKLITYPAPPGLQTSPDLKVNANSVPVWVERAGSRLEKFDHDLGLYGGRKLEDMDVAAFAFEGKVEVKMITFQNKTS